MVSLLRLSIISTLVYAVFCDFEEPEITHIIKFKPNVSLTSGTHLIQSHHREFLTSFRNVRPEIQNEGTISASSYSTTQMLLSDISIGTGFVAIAGVFSDHAFLDSLKQQPSIESVEPNQIYRSTEAKHSVARTQSSNWGLARIRQRQKGDLSEYDFDPSGGSGIDVFVLDTGVYKEHLDFNGRASHSANMIKHEDDNDMGGHGTHVSGKIIGHEYGVAKGANVRAVKILNKNGDGSTSSLLKGIEHVIQNAKPGKSLVNLSLSGPKSKILDQALNSLVLEYNVPVFVSAGNAGTDSCFFSPSSNPNVFAVGAININDEAPRFSNIGECVSIYAPGTDIVSTYIGGVDSSKSMDGTSMASPHVAGIAANLMSQKNYGSAKEVYDAIRELGTKNIISFDSSKSSSPNNNILAFNEV